MGDLDSRISIPPEVYKRLKESLTSSGASSVDELASRILRDWATASPGGARAKSRVSRTDEAVMEERLKALGYV